MSNKQEELKPCPFCGGKAHIEQNKIYCDNCVADIEAIDLDAAIKAWNTRTNTDLEEAQAQVRALTDVLSHAVKVIQDSDEWWMDCPDKGGFDLDRLEQALSSSPIATYQAARAVIDAVNFNSGTLTIIAQGGHFGGETVVHILKLNTTLQELEQSNAGGER